MSEQTVTLESLAGSHELTGVDLGEMDVDHYGHPETVNAVYFVLDGVTYAAVEDPEDGYRSSMREIRVVTDYTVANVFPACRVLCRHVESGRRYAGASDVLEAVDVTTGKIVLEVGTDDVDDYYPGFVGSFWPAAMASNAGVGEA